MIGRYCAVIALGNMKTTELQNLYLIISYAPTIRLVADDWLLYLDWRLLNTVVIDMDFIDRNRRNMMMTFLPDINIEHISHDDSSTVHIRQNTGIIQIILTLDRIQENNPWCAYIVDYNMMMFSPCL